MIKDAQIKIQVINKNLMAVTRGGSTTSIEPNVFEAVKHYLIADAEGKLSKFLPSVVSVLPFGLEDSYPDLFRWYYSLSKDNSPVEVDFAQDGARYRSAVEALDLSKPYNEKVAKDIREQFRRGAKKPAVIEIDAAQIEQGE